VRKKGFPHLLADNGALDNRPVRRIKEVDAVVENNIVLSGDILSLRFTQFTVRRR
jgi:hypothetical protein